MIRIPIDESVWQQLSSEEKLDAICDSYELLLKQGGAPKASDFASLIEIEDRGPLLRELILLNKHYSHERSVVRETRTEKSRSTVSLSASTSDTDIEFLDPDDDHPDPDFEIKLPTDFGDFILYELLGRGSFGKVFRAENTRSGNQVAIKIPHANRISSSDEYRLFVREARNVARLTHPGIVSIYDVGYVDQTPYLVSEWVRGTNLQEYLKSSEKLSVWAAVQIVIELAETVEHAHQHGVVHRDIKPSNIILEKRTSISSDPKEFLPFPRLLDFGIAKLSGANTLVTQAGIVIGTPAYMSPEQARGDSRLTTARSDIYSLGVILYELLSGSTPFQGDPNFILNQVKDRETPPLKERFPEVPSDLSIICHQALQLDPEERYASAAEFANDLRRWLNDEPIHGKSTPFFKRVRKNIVRHRTSLTMVVLFAITLSAIGWSLTRAPRDGRESMANTLLSPMPDSSAAELSRELNEWLGSGSISMTDNSSWVRLIRNANAERLMELGSIIRQDYPEANIALKEVIADQTLELHLRNRVASLGGLIDSEIFEDPEFASQFVDWLVESSCFADVPGWTRLTKEFRKPLLSPLIDHYAKATIASKRSTLRRWLHGLLEDEPARLIVQAAMVGRADELDDWLPLLNRDVAATLDEIQSISGRDEREIGFDERGERQSASIANRLLIEYRLGAYDRLWSALAIQADPRIRTYFVHRFADTKFSIEPLIQRLFDEKNASVQYAILVALSQIPSGRFDEESVQRLDGWLQHQYSTHVDCGVHSMCRWLLNDRGQQATLQQLDRDLIEEGLVENRDWYINRLGMTMRVVWQPLDFALSERPPRADDDEPIGLQAHRIPWGFAIGIDEVTLDQYRQFDPEFPIDRTVLHELTDDADGSYPAVGVSWLQGMAFASWLSSQQGLPSEDIDNWRRSDSETIEVNFRKLGYRLPTKSEWEYGCRAMTTTECSFGSMRTPNHESYSFGRQNPRGFARCGRRLPNTFGIFDCLGNVPEWTTTEFRVDATFAKAESELEILNIRKAICICGGRTLSGDSKSSSVTVGVIKTPRASIGFRVAHTLPTH